MIGRFHANWRMRTTNEMLTSARLPGTHYSSVLTMDAKTAKEVQELVIKHLKEMREVVLPAPSEKAYVFCLDFYPLSGTNDF